jgi:2-oxoglutarate dehydrogenase E2 component (dihydrolipoamide succinyltransferase)
MATKIVVPELGESIIEATVARWLKQEGDYINVGEPVVELETEKVNLEVGADAPGILSSIERQEGEDVQIGDVLGIIEEAEQPPEKRPEEPTEAAPQARVETAEPEEEAPKAEQTPEKRERVPEKPQEARTPGGEEQKRATPVARRLAQEQEIDLARVPASHPGGRVTKEDVQDFAERHKTERQAGPPLPSDERPKREERLRMSRRRRTIARRLVEAQQTAAMLTTFNEIDMSAVMELRQRRKASFQERHGVKLGIVSFFVKASIGALKAFPELNAEIQNDEIVLKHYFDIGVAIGASEGLVVPVLRDADRMSFAQIEGQLRRMLRKQRRVTFL